MTGFLPPPDVTFGDCNAIIIKDKGIRVAISIYKVKLSPVEHVFKSTFPLLFDKIIEITITIKGANNNFLFPEKEVVSVLDQ